jgi:predicted nucleic acid-binding protein
MVCLETTFLIDVLRGHEAAREIVEALETDGVRPTVSPVAAAELWVGAQRSSPSEQEVTATLLESLTWLPFSRRAARRAGELRATLADAGDPIGITDATIAGIAIEHDEVLVTRDAHFDRVEGLRTRSY